MSCSRFIQGGLLLAGLLLWLPLAAATTDAGSGIPASTADHSKFEALQGPFESGPEVTRACLTCHTEAARQLHQTKHWTWEYQHPETGQVLGKKHEPNVFCGSILSNYPRCTSCHIGYGWEDASFDFSSEENVDCLACHDTTGTYSKFPTDAGHPLYEDRKVKGKVVKAPDLAQVAQHVGMTSRETCGSCHFSGGGHDGVKHGDLDSSLIEPDQALDVHMAADGLDFSCATCHTSDRHQVDGSRYRMTAKDGHGVDIPGRDDGRASCESCHGDRPHAADHDKLNDHTDRVACQTCHIPEFARGGIATKTFWDWSTATRLDENGKPITRLDEHGHAVYLSTKGDFKFGENVQPEYHWFNGTVKYTKFGDTIDPDQVVSVNDIEGSADDPDSRIWPFKVMRGRQPYDKVTNSLLVTHVFGKDDTALWTNFDWSKALEAGMAEAVAVGEVTQPFSGEYGFVDNRMFWPITHMVAPAEEALGCAECHSQDGRLANLEGVYIPGRDAFGILDNIGWIVVVLTLLGALVHGFARFLVKRKKREA